jgi:hypothetical protein
MDAAPFVERYAIYNWLNGNRELIVDGSLTAAGEVTAVPQDGVA